MKSVNARRKLLNLPEIGELTADTKLDGDLSSARTAPRFNKQSALRDLSAVSDAAKGFPDLAKAEATAIVADLAKLEADPALFAALQRRAFIEKGLELVDGPECPLCDSSWGDEQRLIDHLKEKLAKSDEARKLQQALLANGAALAKSAINLTGHIRLAESIAEGQGDAAFSKDLSDWKKDLEELQSKLTTVDRLMTLKDRLSASWLQMPKKFLENLKTLTQKVNEKPGQTASLDAQTFLTTAQLRLGDYREAMRKNKAAENCVRNGKGRVRYVLHCHGR
ncbi:MAG: hypothetical protein ACREQV_17140 [Candidatus Binatia bacterium]